MSSEAVKGFKKNVLRVVGDQETAVDEKDVLRAGDEGPVPEEVVVATDRGQEQVSETQSEQ